MNTKSTREEKSNMLNFIPRNPFGQDEKTIQIRTLVTDDISELELTKTNCAKQVNYLKEKFPEYQGIIESKIYDIETSLVY